MPDGTTQIDHIFVSHYGVFVVETKNTSGWIFGNERDRHMGGSLLVWYGPARVKTTDDLTAAERVKFKLRGCMCVHWMSFLDICNFMNLLTLSYKLGSHSYSLVG